MKDTVHVHGMRLTVQIGFHEFERHIRQSVRVDLALATDFRAGPERDQHEGLVDYNQLVAHLTAYVKDQAWDLVEALAVDLTRQIFRVAPVAHVRIRVTKLPLDMPDVDSVSVECERAREDFPPEPAA